MCFAKQLLCFRARPCSWGAQPDEGARPLQAGRLPPPVAAICRPNSSTMSDRHVAAASAMRWTSAWAHSHRQHYLRLSCDISNACFPKRHDWRGGCHDRSVCVVELSDRVCSSFRRRQTWWHDVLIFDLLIRKRYLMTFHFTSQAIQSRPFLLFFSRWFAHLFWLWEGSNYPSRSRNGRNGPKGPKFK